MSPLPAGRLGQAALPKDGRAVESVVELQGRGVVVLTKTQMAAALQVCPRTITEMMRRGQISYFKISRQLVRFRIEEALKRMNETVLVPEEGPLMDADER